MINASGNLNHQVSRDITILRMIGMPNPRASNCISNRNVMNITADLQHNSGRAIA